VVFHVYEGYTQKNSPTRKREATQCNTAKLHQPRSDMAVPMHQHEALENGVNIYKNSSRVRVDTLLFVFCNVLKIKLKMKPTAKQMDLLVRVGRAVGLCSWTPHCIVWYCRWACSLAATLFLVELLFVFCSILKTKLKIKNETHCIV